MIADLAALGSALTAWLPGQRWFQGKDREITGVAVVDAARLDERLLVVIAEVAYEDGGSDSYLVTLTPDKAGPVEGGGQRWAEALGDRDAMRLLAARCCTGDATPTDDGGIVVGAPVSGRRPPADAPVRALSVEQSNSSAILGDAWFLKVLRRLEPGVHPDIELTAALTERGFPHVPAQHGSLWLDTDGERTALAVLSTFAPGSREGWDLATADMAGRGPSIEPDLPALGTAVAEMHVALADAFGRRPASADQAVAWSEAMRMRLRRVMDAAARLAPDATAEARSRAAEADALFARLAVARDVGPLIRIHGDLHLGQVLRAADGRWLILDFEGEPIVPLAQRRAPGSPLRDVAGMLRSFDYAAAAPGGGKVTAETAAMRDRDRELFLAAYLDRAASLLPDDATTDLLIAVWELDKAVYELSYEMANRPGWVAIPAGGIVRLLG